MTHPRQPDDQSPSDIGSTSETDALFTLVYDELRKMAERQLATEPRDMTLQATALVHEAFLKLSGSERTWSDRRQFFIAAAEAMRRILVDHARKRKRLRRGSKYKRVAHDMSLLPELRPDDEVIAIADLLAELDKSDDRATHLVKLRYFAGMSLEEAGEILGVSRSTAARDWQFAKAWLHSRLSQRRVVDDLARDADPPELS